MDFLKDEYGVPEFHFISREFPVDVGSKYLYVDVLGLETIPANDHQVPRLVLLEAKVDLSKRDAASVQVQEYCRIIENLNDSSRGFPYLYYIRACAWHGLESSAIAASTQKDCFIAPVILNPNSLAPTRLEFNEMFRAYRKYCIDRMIRRFPRLHEDFASIDRDKIPLYPSIIDNGLEKSLVIHYFKINSPQNVELVELKDESIDKSGTVYPTVYKQHSDSNDMFENLSSHFHAHQEGSFYFQFFTNGRNKPGLFVEVENGKFACVTQWNKNQYVFFSLFNEIVAKDFSYSIRDFEATILPGTIGIDEGRYVVEKKDASGLKIIFHGMIADFSIHFKPARFFMLGFYQISRINYLKP